MHALLRATSIMSLNTTHYIYTKLGTVTDERGSLVNPIRLIRFKRASN